MRFLPIAIVLLLLSVLESAHPAPGDSIRPWREDARYWEYRGQPVLLVGGTKTDHIFLLDDLEEHLDELVKAGGNFVRSTMSQREGADLKPHLRLADGRFDLDRWNQDYWRRFEKCLELCGERQIVIQIEVWDRFDFSQEHWEGSPWRPANNVNYGTAESGLANRYPDHPWRDRQPFFHTLPGMPLHRPGLEIVREHQERLVEKILSYSLEHDHVLYCMNNETSTPPAWGRSWMRFIQERAKKKGVTVFTTDMFDDGWKPRQSEKIRQALDDPAAYPFLDVSQVNSRTFGEDHWNNIVWLTREARKHPRPLNHVKIYSDGQTRWGSGTPQDGIERMWRNLIAGSAAVRFHRDGAGIGLNALARACLRSVRLVEEHVRFWEVEPHQDLLRGREKNEAYLAAKPGKAYVLFFPKGGEVTLDLKDHAGPWSIRWIEISTGRAKEPVGAAGGKLLPLKAPGRGPWALTVTPSGLPSRRT